MFNSPGFFRADGGGTPDMAAAQTPQSQALYQRFQSMSPEQLQEMVVRMGATPSAQVAQRVLEQKRIAPQPQQPTEQPQGFAAGGMMSPSQGAPWWTRAEAKSADSGFLHTAGPGRTDNINIHPQTDSYVLPAHIVSGEGQGNSLAGAHAIQLALSTGPHGIPLAHGPSGYHGPRAPTPYHESTGGAVPRVPIVAAGGELVLNPDQVKMASRLVGGPGTIKHGHAVLDRYVVHRTKELSKEISKLKGPVGAKKS